MLNIFLKTKLYKVNNIIETDNLYAGILYDSDGFVVDKIMFVKNNNVGIDVFDDREYSLFVRDNFYIDDVVPLDKLIWDFMKKDKLNLAEQLLVFKRFLNDDKFIKEYLDYFGLREIEVGYKGKTEIISKTKKYIWLKENPNIDIYRKLLKIIYCKDLNKGKFYERSKGK